MLALVAALAGIAAVSALANDAAAAGMAIRPSGITATSTSAAVVEALVAERPWLVDGAKAKDLVVSSVTPGRGTAASIVRLEEEIQGVPVLGGEVVAAVDHANRVVAISGSSLAGAEPSLTPRINASEARRLAITALARELGLGLRASTPTLAIYDPRLLGFPGLQRAVLVWDLQVTRVDGIRRRVLIDAEQGFLAFVLDEVHSVDIKVCDENGREPDYYCNPGGAGSWSTSRVNTATPTGVADVDNAYDFAGETYSFYSGLGRNSIDNNGLSLLSNVRICPTNPSPYSSPCTPSYANAYWDGRGMFYGPGFANADDVVAHEMTHGVTDYVSDLYYYAQSGAINEGLSDVFGQFVDLSNSTVDAADDSGANRWLMGEDLPGGAIRDMQTPGTFTDPDRTGSSLYYGGPRDHNGVHWNSGVVNKTAFLLTDGATFNGQTVTGIGLSKSARIWYQAALLLRANSQLADLDTALRSACTTLVGSYSITTADCGEVAKATLATELATPPTNAVTPQAPVCAAGDQTAVFSDDAEAGALTAKWTQVNLAGSATTWTYTTTYPAGGSKSLNSAASAGTPGRDNALQQTTAVVVPAAAYLRFRQAYQFYVGSPSGNTYDGGVVEYSADGGAWTDISGLTVVNGYSGTIVSGYSNSLQGRAAFVSTSAGYIGTRVDLSSLAGHSVKFRFRLATASGSLGDYGWFIDDVSIYSCTHPLAVVRAGSGSGAVTSAAAGISCGGTCTAPFGVGASVTLSAAAAARSTFTGWSGAGCSGTGACTVTMSAAKSVTATFAAPPPDPTPTPDPAPPPAPGPIASPPPLPLTTTVPKAVSGVVGAFITVAGPGTAAMTITPLTGGPAVCTSAVAVRKAGKAKVSCKLPAAVRKALKKVAIKVVVVTTFSGADGRSWAASNTVTLKRTY